MKKLLFFCLLLISISLESKAQLNYVLNGSFETHDSCPYEDDQVRYAKYWDALDTNYVFGDSTYLATSDQFPEYLNTCGISTGAVPDNGHYHHYPRTGNGMIESAIYYDYAYIYDGWNEFNYLQGRLKTHLVAGKSYCVTFYVCEEQGASISINKIGAYLDNGTIDTTRRPQDPQSQYTPQVVDTAVISDTLNWTRIQGSFIANGTERFITIGMFYDTASVTKVPTGRGWRLSLYLIDDVSVIESDAVAYAGRDTSIRPGDTVSIGATQNGDGMPCWWYKLGNSVVIDSGGTIRVHPDSTTTYVVKMDLCGTVTWDTVKVGVWPASIINVQSPIVNVLVYPNPASNEITIQNAKGCAVVFYDVVGKAILHAFCDSDNEAIGISTLPIGVYTIQVVDIATGEKAVRKVIKE